MAEPREVSVPSRSPRAMNRDFEVYKKAEEAGNTVREILKDFEFENEEEQVLFIARLVSRIFNELTNYEDELINFTMGPNRAFLQAYDVSGKRYQISVRW